MKTLKLKVDTGDMELSDEEKKMGPVVMSLKIIQNVVNTYGNSRGPNKHYQGFNKQDRKQLYAIMHLFKKAKDDKPHSIQLEDAQAAFIQRAFTTEFMPNEVVAIVEANVEEMMK